MEILVEYMAKGFLTMLSISMPCVLVAATVGLVIGILQAVTQVQEQTIAAAPKICLVFLSIIIFGGFFIKTLTNFFFEGANIAFNHVTKNDAFVLPEDYFKYTKPFSAEMKDKIETDKNFNKALINNGNIPWDKKALKHQIYINSKQTNSVEPNFIERMKINTGR